jgi:hypothetical protein
VPTITLEGDANGAPHPEPAAYAKKFSGKYAHRLVTGGIGHNLPQEAPEVFAKAVVDVARRPACEASSWRVRYAGARRAHASVAVSARRASAMRAASRARRGACCTWQACDDKNMATGVMRGSCMSISRRQKRPFRFGFWMRAKLRGCAFVRCA